jgi:hypothetical protein
MALQKDIPEYEGIYRITEYGDIFAYSKSFFIRNRWQALVEIKLSDKKLSVGKTGRYARCTLSKDGSPKSYSVHRLVALAFIPNPLNLPQVNHKDGNKFNNHYSNLEWCTSSDNTKHAYDTGLINKKNVGKHRIGIMPHGTKEILDLNTGIFYESMKAAEKAAMITPNTLRAYLKDNSRYIGSSNYSKFNGRFVVLQ